MRKLLLTLLTLICSIGYAVAGNKTVDVNYVFVAQTAMQTIGNTDNKVSSADNYDPYISSFSSTTQGYAENKGKSTIGGTDYFNTMQMKVGRGVQFKVAKACTLTIYGQEHGSRTWSLGTSINGTEVGSYKTSADPIVVEITESFANKTLYLTATGDLYLGGLEFTGFSTEKNLSGAWSATEATGVVGITTFTVPEFTASLTNATLTADDYSVAYTLKEGSTAGIITLKADGTGIEAISNTTAGEATVVATLSTTKSDITIEQATYEFKVTVNAELDKLVSISETTTWDFSKFGTSLIELSAETAPARGESFVMSNLKKYGHISAFAEGFNAQAIEFNGQHAVRDGKYSQGASWKFNTTVPGTVTVEFSNTGNRGDDESLRRYVAVNGNVTVFGSLVSGNNTTTTQIPVSAGDVEITGVFADGSSQYIRVYKITFTPASIEATKKLDVNGFTTCTADYAFTVRDAKAYKVSKVTDGGAVVLDEVTDAIPAGEGVILYGETNGSATISPATSAATEIEGNLLKGVSSLTTASDIEGTYVLANNGTETAFVLAGSTTLSRLAGKAYLDIPESGSSKAQALRIVFNNDPATAISEVAADATDAAATIYNLAGQKVSAAAKGIVIKKGKKFVK